MDVRETGYSYLFLRMYYVKDKRKSLKLNRELRQIAVLCHELDEQRSPDEDDPNTAEKSEDTPV